MLSDRQMHKTLLQPVTVRNILVIRDCLEKVFGECGVAVFFYKSNSISPTIDFRVLHWTVNPQFLLLNIFMIFLAHFEKQDDRHSFFPNCSSAAIFLLFLTHSSRVLKSNYSKRLLAKLLLECVWGCIRAPAHWAKFTFAPL